MRHCKEAVQEFCQQLKQNPRPDTLWETYQSLLAQFSSEDELEEAIALLGCQSAFLEWVGEQVPSLYAFQYNDRIGIALPIVYVEWEQLPFYVREEIVDRWESIRAQIPDRIGLLDRQVEKLQEEISQEEDWDRVCDLFAQISELASVINELNIWYRVQQEV